MSQVSELISYLEKRNEEADAVFKTFRRSEVMTGEAQYQVGREHAFKEVIEYIQNYFDGV